MKKLINKKNLFIIGCIIIISILYVIVENAIDNYNFTSSDEISIKDTNDSTDITVENKEDLDNTKENVAEGIGDEEFWDDNITESVENSNVEVNNQLENKSKIYVYVTGEVNNPGVVNLDEGSRIIDAINAAGGTTDKANITKINLVYVVDDGMKVNIPSNNDLNNNSDFEFITMSSGEGRDDSSSSEREKSLPESHSDSKESNKYFVVNINTATQTELETLPGIGPSLALKIINYRKENGKFSTIEAVKNVSGIGESKFEELKKYIKV